MIEPARDRSVSCGKPDCLLDTLEGVCEGSDKLPISCRDWDAEAKSFLFPANITVKFGDASALASIKKVGSASNEA